MKARLDSLVSDMQAIYRVAVRAVQADRLMTGINWDGLAPKPLDRYERVLVAGMGKAAMAMAGVLEGQIGERIREGAVVVPHGYPATLPVFLPRPVKIEVMEGAHPVPAAASIHAARRMLHLAESCRAGDLLIVLISGGGSSLCVDFAEGVSLEDARITFRRLLECGADIHAMNAVRKHISRIGGGRLAEAAAPADVLALVVSDVVGNDLSVIASGPTVPDPSTFEDAAAVLRENGLWEEVPRSVRRHVEAGCQGVAQETPKPGDPFFESTMTELIGTNRTALEAAAAEAGARGYAAYLLSDGVTGEARTVGKRLAEEAKGIAAGQPVCLLWGGETTVTVRGKGKGGRNQEAALGAALALEGCHRPITFLSGGTDGRDGPTEAAGAWATPETVRAARDAGLVPETYLANNDAYAFFERTGSLLVTGPTHTNVMDVQIALIHPS